MTIQTAREKIRNLGTDEGLKLNVYCVGILLDINVNMMLHECVIYMMYVKKLAWYVLYIYIVNSHDYWCNRFTVNDEDDDDDDDDDDDEKLKAEVYLFV